MMQEFLARRAGAGRHPGGEEHAPFTPWGPSLRWGDGAVARLVDPAGSPAREIIAEVERELPRERARLAAAPEADSLAGAGRHAEAEALYRAALAAGKGDPGEINARLGMALVLAGRRSQAEAAFREAAKSGRYADLAQFWLLWLAQGR